MTSNECQGTPDLRAGRFSQGTPDLRAGRFSLRGSLPQPTPHLPLPARTFYARVLARHGQWVIGLAGCPGGDAGQDDLFEDNLNARGDGDRDEQAVEAHEDAPGE
jgi:hypothetical protein